MPEILTAPIRSAFHRVKSAIQDNDARLRDALADVRRLQDALKAIQNEIAGRKFKLLRRCAGNMPPLSLAASVTAADPDESWREFVKQYPHWRETLRQACAIKLAIAQADCAAANERTRGELSGEEFSEAEISNHPRLRRTNHCEKLWRRMVEACANEKGAAGLWVRVTKELL